jgi:hypothetical protein
LLVSLRSSAGKNNQANVEGIDVPDVIVKQLKVPKVTSEADAPADIIVKAVKAMKMPAGKVDVDSVDSRDLKVQPIKLEGIEDLPKKFPQDDDDSINNAVKTAESNASAAGAADPDQTQSFRQTMNQASLAAGQAATDQGESEAQANQDAQEARKRVRDDYRNAVADGGVLPAAAPEEKSPAPPTAPAEAAPEVLEPPPKEPAEGGDGEPAEAPAPAVIDVPSSQ